MSDICVVHAADELNQSEMLRRVDHKYYEVVRPASLAEKLMVIARDRIYDDFIRVANPELKETILDVGVSDVVNEAANVLERRYPFPNNITAVGLGPGGDFKAEFPSVTYQQVRQGTPLPFSDGSFDVVTSNAVLEHAGSLENQRRMLSEMMRVGRRVFLTVPCRFFPVEHHTAIPFLHWTDSTFSVACLACGKQDWARSENLILMSRRRLRAVCPTGVSAKIASTGIPLGPFSSNLYMYLTR